jgi:hypothetical protein
LRVPSFSSARAFSSATTSVSPSATSGADGAIGGSVGGKKVALRACTVEGGGIA